MEEIQENAYSERLAQDAASNEGMGLAPGAGAAVTETSPDGPPGRFAPSQRQLHWVVAALVLAQLAVGIWIGTTPRAGNEALIRQVLVAHLANGTLIFGLMWRRWNLRRTLGVPAPPPGTPVDADALAKANHLAFYALLFALPVLGWMTYLSHGQSHEVLAATHGGLALALVLAIGAHLAGVAYHMFARGDGLLKRML